MNRETPLPLAKGLRTHEKTATLHPSTGRRWYSKGVRLSSGRVIRLHLELIGSRLFVSHAAIDRFLNELNETTEVPTAPRSPAKRQAESDKADAELQRMGA